ncbi:hypothetical protein OV203_46980 [Nannocystis sp. ILAH1]|uniref:hypothetical protein n=1 Tax=Nannocystis sp. ILAH1 TaxID=2996789 RepID=UPI00226EC28C|nr:hypothetical protein [Nannocystis sp. ILAH1]MCY0994761.1 hypothetical protein [Nannocystis sp. ILAH1]
MKVTRLFLIFVVCAGCTEPARSAEPARPVEPPRTRPVPPGPWHIVYVCGAENHGLFWSKEWLIDLGAQRRMFTAREGANNVVGLPSETTTAALSPQTASELESLTRDVLASAPYTTEAAELGGTACVVTIRSADEPHVEHLRVQRQSEGSDPPGRLVAALLRAFEKTEVQ